MNQTTKRVQDGVAIVGALMVTSMATALMSLLSILVALSENSDSERENAND